MQLREGTAVMWREPGVLQVGADPDDHLVLDRLSGPEVAWLMAAGLDAVPVDPFAPSPRREVRLPPLPAGSRLPARLGAAGFLRPDVGAGPPLPGGVRLDGIDTVTLAAAQLLAQVGVRRFDLVDHRHVDLALADVLPAGSLGAPRTSAAAEALSGVHLGTTTGRLAAPDLVIVSRTRRVDPSTTGMLMAEDQPHLLVVQRERSLVVGPLVLPGQTSCSHCVDLHLTDRDHRWPFLIEEALGCPLAAPDPAAAHVAGLEVARAALGATGHPLLGGGDPHDSTPHLVHVDRGGNLRREPSPGHPRCGCGAAGTVFAPVSPDDPGSGTQGSPTSTCTSSPRTIASTAGP